MNTPSSNQDRPEGAEPADVPQPEPETGPAGGGAGAQGEPAAQAPREDAGGAYDPFIAEETEDEEPPDAEGYAVSGAAARAGRGGGAFGAETCAVAAVLAIGGALVGPRLAEMFASVTAQDQVSAISRTIAGDGVVALIGVVLGLLGLGLAGPRSRPWARWASAAAVLIGVLFVALSVVTYLMVPAPTPAPMGPQM